MTTEVCWSAEPNMDVKTCYTVPARTKWYQDPALWEFMGTRVFWALAIFVTTNAYWVNQQTERFNEVSRLNRAQSANPGTESEATAAADATDPASPAPAAPTRYSLFWLQPHITSRLRQVLAVIIMGVVIPVQLLEGSWVLRTTWRATGVTFGAARGIRTGLFRYVTYLPLMVGTLAAWVIVLTTGVFVVVMQLLYVLRLQEIEPAAPLGPVDDDDKSDDWQEVRDVKEVVDEKGNIKEAVDEKGEDESLL